MKPWEDITLWGQVYQRYQRLMGISKPVKMDIDFLERVCAEEKLHPNDPTLLILTVLVASQAETREHVAALKSEVESLKRVCRSRQYLPLICLGTVTIVILAYALGMADALRLWHALQR